ncbi:hypothetical protein [Nakamurella lactea]|uniref:hypothetical protein n=1 Tax=Nakamurella lactea TaxID=459515 RepID=UPI00040943F6|nr:hypothetical protein [Nakamurella lactea]
MIMTVSPRYAVVAAALLFVTLTGAAPDTTTDPGCDGITSTTYLHLDGTPAAGAGPNIATIYHYGGSNMDVSAAQMPADFSPLTASAETLAVFGLEPRPTDPVDLARWKAQYAHYHSVAPASMCSSGNSN